MVSLRVVQLAWDLRSSMLHASLGVYVVVVYVIAEQSFIIVHVVIVVILIIVIRRVVRQGSSLWWPFLNRGTINLYELIPLINLIVNYYERFFVQNYENCLLYML